MAKIARARLLSWSYGRVRTVVSTSGFGRAGGRDRYALPTTLWRDSSIGMEQFLAELRERFAHFGLQLHADKTRILEFGRFAGQNRRQRGEGKPETFNFLGFTHICGRTRKGHFTVLRQTMRQRQQARQWAYACVAAVAGHFRYYEVPMNGPALKSFHGVAGRLWWRILRRRGQKHHLPWRRMRRYIQSYLSSLSATALGRCRPRCESDALVAPVRICGGGREQSRSLLQPGRPALKNR